MRPAVGVPHLTLVQTWYVDYVFRRCRTWTKPFNSEQSTGTIMEHELPPLPYPKQALEPHLTGLGMARGQQRQARDRFHRESGLSADGQSRRGRRRHADPRRRCLGTCLLPEIPEQARGLFEGVLECGELG